MLSLSVNDKSTRTKANVRDNQGTNNNKQAEWKAMPVINNLAAFFLLPRQLSLSGNRFYLLKLQRKKQFLQILRAGTVFGLKPEGKSSKISNRHFTVLMLFILCQSLEKQRCVHIGVE